MAQIIELQLSGGTSVFVEAEPEADGGMEEMAGGSDRIIKKFDEISATLTDVANTLEQHLSKIEKGPSKVELEIHAVLKAGGKLYLVQGSAEGGIKLKLSWDR